MEDYVKWYHNVLVPYTHSYQHYVSKVNLCDFMYISLLISTANIISLWECASAYFPFIWQTLSDIFAVSYYDQDCY